MDLNFLLYSSCSKPITCHVHSTYTKTSLLSCPVVSPLTAVDGRPQRCESSHDDLLRLHSAYNFATVEYAGAHSSPICLLHICKNLLWRHSFNKNTFILLSQQLQLFHLELRYDPLEADRCCFATRWRKQSKNYDKGTTTSQTDRETDRRADKRTDDFS